jgi:DNA-binding NarL/FixJ family response regulator
MQAGVIIYEDNHLLRNSVAEMIRASNDFLLLASSADVTEVEEQIRDIKPEIILMDIDMPGGMNGIEAVRKIRAFDQQVYIIMLTVFDDNNIVLDAICAGASGYLLKKHLPVRLMDAMHEVMSGGAPMSPAVARMVMASMQKFPAQEENRYFLTSRELEILAALEQGSGYKIIAAQYFITIDTVRSHIKNIYQKMQVHTKLEAVAKARNSGIV